MSIIVRCRRNSGDKEAPSISDSLIITESMAVSRGKRFLDDPGQGAYYLTKKRSLRVPHNMSGEVAINHIEPGKWVTVTDGKLGLASQKVKIKAYNVTITPTSVWGSMETETYEEMT